MMITQYTKSTIGFVMMVLISSEVCIVLPDSAHAQLRTIEYDASELLPRTDVMVTPSSGTFEEGSTFDVSVFLNTHKNNINAVELKIRFTPGTLSVVRPSSGKSIIGLWVEPPSYDNTNGTIRIAGAIPGGITSDAGLITTVTFKTKAPGQGVIEIGDSSQALLNNGAGTPTTLRSSRGVYTVVPRPPGGVSVYSDTHPFQDRWYNNANPVIAWNKDPGVAGFSYTIDNRPNTVPNNVITSTDTSVAYQELGDGLSYFHIKSNKQGVWGIATHYALRIDTAPPAVFVPKIDHLSASVTNRVLLSFFTTDGLSGVDHYEVGVIDKTAPTTESPIFVETESPYQLPSSASQNARVIVRAFDQAGNLRDTTIDVTIPFLPTKFFYDHINEILIGIILILISGTIAHYFYGHHIIKYIRRIIRVAKEDDKKPPEFRLDTSPPPQLE